MRDTAVAGGNPHLKHSSETKFLLDMVCGRSGMVFRCRVEPALPFRGLGRAGGAGVGVVSGGGDVFEEAWDQVGRLGDVGCCAFLVPTCLPFRSSPHARRPAFGRFHVIGLSRFQGWGQHGPEKL